jgi:hypothetical protein
MGEDTLVVIGKIDITKQSKVIKTYSAMCTFEKMQSIFYQGATSPELRRTGLLNIRDKNEV